MCELDTTHYLVNRDLEYAEFDFEEIPLKVYDAVNGEWISTESMFAGKVRVDEDFNVDWIDVGVKLDRTQPANSLQRQLFDGLEGNIKDAIKIQFGDWLASIPADDPYENERDLAYYRAQVL